MYSGIVNIDRDVSPDRKSKNLVGDGEKFRRHTEKVMVVNRGMQMFIEEDCEKEQFRDKSSSAPAKPIF